MKTLLAATAAALLLTAGAAPGIAYAQGKAETKMENVQEKGKSAESKGKAEVKGKSETKGIPEVKGQSDAKGQAADKGKK